MQMVGDSPRRHITSCFEIAQKMIKAEGPEGLLHAATFQAVGAAVKLTKEEAEKNPAEIISKRLVQLVESEAACLALTLVISAGFAAMQLESDRRDAAGNN